MSLRHHFLTAAVPPAAVLSIMLSSTLVGLLMLCALAAAQTSAPSLGACRHRLAAFSPREPALAWLEGVYRRHTRFGPAGHNPLPHYYADQADIEQAHAELKPDDIALIVYQLRAQTLPRHLRIVPIGVLARFGSAALPCLAAGMEGAAQGPRALLQQIRIEIEANQFPSR